MAVLRWIYVGLVGVAAFPWLTSGATKAASFGGTAILVAITVAATPRLGFAVSSGFAVFAFGVLGLGVLFPGPEMGPLEIDGMKLTGIRFALLVVAVIGPVLGYRRAKGTAACQSKSELDPTMQPERGQ